MSKAAPPTDAILVGAASPPVPAKIAQRIWELKFVGMEELLPARLGAEPLFMEALSNTIKTSRQSALSASSSGCADSTPTRQ